MTQQNTEYMDTRAANEHVRRMAVLLSPVLIMTPLVISIILLVQWFIQGYLQHDARYTTELILGVVIIVGNILFDIPFVQSLRKSSTKKVHEHDKDLNE